MIRDLVTRVLPGKNRAQIEGMLGCSPTPAESRRYSTADLEFRERDENGNWKPFPRTGQGYYWDEFDWDLLYYIGKEQIFIFDHKGQELSPDPEVLLIRLDPNGVFVSWYIDGSTRWPNVVGKAAMTSFRKTRL